MKRNGQQQTKSNWICSLFWTQIVENQTDEKKLILSFFQNNLLSYLFSIQ